MEIMRLTLFIDIPYSFLFSTNHFQAGISKTETLVSLVSWSRLRLFESVGCQKREAIKVRPLPRLKVEIIKDMLRLGIY